MRVLVYREWFFEKGWESIKIIFVQISNLSLKPNYTFYISLFLKYEKAATSFFAYANFDLVTD